MLKGNDHHLLTYHIDGLVQEKRNSIAVFALRFQNLPAQNSSLKIFKHEKEEKLAGPKRKLAGPAQILVAEGLGPALNAKTALLTLWSYVILALTHRYVTQDFQNILFLII